MGKERIVYVILTLCLLMTMAVFPNPSESRAVHRQTHRTSTTKRTVTKKSTRAKRSTAKTKKAAKKTSRKKATPRKKRRGTATTKKARYAYPAEFFMWSAPERAAKASSPVSSSAIRNAFTCGVAGQHDPTALVQAGVFSNVQPLLGGIFQRREPVRYIVLHSTETESPADAQRVIRSWNHGMRHPGAQYVVDRDGTIYQACDPNYGTVHVDIFRAQNGINNDNSIGIEIVRSGKQKYTPKQLDSVTRLVAYLQDHFKVTNDSIVGHGQIQPSNRTDPVDFNWNNFVANLTSLNKSDAQITLTPKNKSWFDW